MSADAPSTWVLLRGLTRETGHWGDFPEQLRARLPGARMVPLDLPGNGARHGEHSPSRVPGFVERVRWQLRQQGVTGPVNVLAMSLGAMVAADWAQRHPRELAGAVLINTSLKPFSPVRQRLRPANYARLLRIALGTASGLQAERLVLEMTSQMAGDRAATLAEWTRLRARHPVSAGNALRQLLAAARYRAPSTAPAVPLLLLAGAGDTLVDPACSRALARQWHAPLAEHPHAGHDLPLDDGPWVAEQVRTWLAAT